MKRFAAVHACLARFPLTCEAGSSLLETAIVLPVMLLLLVAAIDFGSAYYTSITLNSAAAAGAFYGLQNPSDIAGMVLAAKMDGVDSLTLIPTATYGCECADGSGASTLCVKTPVCTTNVVNYVEVDTVATYTPKMVYPGLPKILVLNSKARVRVAQ